MPACRKGSFAPQPPTPVAAPRLLKLNEALARELGLDPAQLLSPEGVDMLAGNAFPEGAAAIATAYAGHQFGHFVPQLGDGRALLLGEVVGRDGKRRDLQLKGSGPTPFSRSGDGRAALGPVLREYLVSEAMHALGIPTTRALSAVATGEHVFREAALPGAVLCRVASSHIRVGTFQFFAARGDVERVRALAAHAIERHYPDAAEAENPHLALLSAVVSAQARLVAQWMLVGFVHGVMNTDNASIAGETIDFGPCAFLDAYDPATVFSSIDRMGRYAYGMQPRIALWNCTRLAEALLPLLGADEDAAIAAAQAALGAYGPIFDAAHGLGLRRKLGLVEAHEGDTALANDLLARMEAGRADFTLAFRQLGRPRRRRRPRPARPLRRSGRLRRLAAGLAGPLRRRADGARGARRPDARRQPGRDPAQPHGRDGAGGGGAARRPRPLRGAAGGGDASLRRAARLRPTRGARRRVPHLLRHLKSYSKARGFPSSSRAT
jgi:uncharacterized protein YdiU (UPF0061 family)